MSLLPCPLPVIQDRLWGKTKLPKSLNKSLSPEVRASARREEDPLGWGGSQWGVGRALPGGRRGEVKEMVLGR